MWCHLLLVMPVAGALIFFIAPASIAVPAYLLIAGASGFVYWKMARAIMLPPAMGVEGMTGRLGKAASDIAPQGFVRFDGALWRAVSKEKVIEGQDVRIVGLDGNRVLVEPYSRRQVQHR